MTILIPAADEELTITDFVAWCHEGLREAGAVGEILIVDSSSDRTAELALAGGARVLKAPRRGLGRAYIDALPYVRGKYVIMGDADCTYDFRRLAPFIGAMRGGTEYAMGSRWKGSIESGAMPALHRYLGPPVPATKSRCGLRRGQGRDGLPSSIHARDIEQAYDLVRIYVFSLTNVPQPGVASVRPHSLS